VYVGEVWRFSVVGGLLVAWFWTDELARVLIERDGVDPQRLSDWITAPIAHRSDADALEFARELLALTAVPDVATTAA
jgi:hypothetical protein